MERIPDHEITRRVKSLCEFLKAKDVYRKLEPIYERAHRVSDRCHELFLKKARIGSYIRDVYNEIVEYVSKEGLSDVFMGEGKLYCPWYI